MPDRRKELLSRIEDERLRQFNLPGAEYDLRNTPNDWIAIATRYLASDPRRGGIDPDKADFEDSLVKAAAVVLAALEHLDEMERRGHFR